MNDINIWNNKAIDDLFALELLQKGQVEKPLATLWLLKNITGDNRNGIQLDRRF